MFLASLRRLFFRPPDPTEVQKELLRVQNRNTDLQFLLNASTNTGFYCNFCRDGILGTAKCHAFFDENGRKYWLCWHEKCYESMKEGIVPSAFAEDFASASVVKRQTQQSQKLPILKDH